MQEGYAGCGVLRPVMPLGDSNLGCPWQVDMIEKNMKLIQRKE